jgi:hypothetical protein
VVPPHELRCKNLVCWFPRVVGLGVALPFDQILELLLLPMVTVGTDGLHLIFFPPLHEVGGWSHKVDPVLIGLLVWGEEQGVEDVMNGPGGGQVELISDGQDLFRDCEGSVTFRGQLRRVIGKGQMCCLQPDSVPLFIDCQWGLARHSIEGLFHLFMLLGCYFLSCFHSWVGRGNGRAVVQTGVVAEEGLNGCDLCCVVDCVIV